MLRFFKNWRAHGKRLFERSAAEAHPFHEGGSFDAVLRRPFLECSFLVVRFMQAAAIGSFTIAGWCREHFFGAHFAFTDSLHQCSVTNNATRVFGPFDDNLCFSESGKQNVTATIPCLFFFGSKPTILRCIVSVIIDAFYRQVLCVAISNRPLHERVALMPFDTDGNSSCSIVGVPNVADTVATMHHLLPDSRKSWLFYVGHLLNHFTFFGTQGHYRSTMTHQFQF